MSCGQISENTYLFAIGCVFRQDHDTPLLRAAYYGSANVVQQLIDIGADVNHCAQVSEPSYRNVFELRAVDNTLHPDDQLLSNSNDSPLSPWFGFIVDIRALVIVHLGNAGWRDSAAGCLPDGSRRRDSAADRTRRRHQRVHAGTVTH
jgi:hypothetical protein